jgi:hypothetical protein
MELEGTEYSPRGFAFWNILDEGKTPLSQFEQKKDKKFNKYNENITNDSDDDDNDDPFQPLWLSSKLNEILNIRK